MPFREYRQSFGGSLRFVCGSRLEDHDADSKECEGKYTRTNLVIFDGLYELVYRQPDGYALTVSSTLGACTRRNEERTRQLVSFSRWCGYFHVDSWNEGRKRRNAEKGEERKREGVRIHVESPSAR